MIASFEDLKVWQKARELTDLVYKTSSKFSSVKVNLNLKTTTKTATSRTLKF